MTGNRCFWLASFCHVLWCVVALKQLDVDNARCIGGSVQSLKVTLQILLCSALVEQATTKSLQQAVDIANKVIHVIIIIDYNNRLYWIHMLSLQLIIHMVHRLVIWLVSIYS